MKANKTHLNLKFKLANAKRYIGKVCGSKSFFTITMNKNYMYDEELFIATIIHELVHVDYFMLDEENGGILTFDESDAIGNLHDDRELDIGDYSNLEVDYLHWDVKRKRRKMVIQNKKMSKKKKEKNGDSEWKK
jgi:hypothetical protein